MKVKTVKLLVYFFTYYIIVLFICSITLAQDADKPVVFRIGLKETINQALEASEALQIEENNIEKNEDVFKEARSAFLPHLDGAAAWTRNTNYPSSSANEDYNLSTGVAATQLLWSFGEVSSAVRAVTKALEMSRFTRDFTRREVICSAKLSYYSALLAGNTLGIVEQSYQNAQQSKKLLENRSSGGRISKRDRIKMDADIASRVPQVNNARAQFQSTLYILKSTIDVKVNSHLELTDMFKDKYDELVYEALEKALYENEPSLKALDKNIAAAEHTVKSKKAGCLPKISAFASYEYTGSTNDSHYVTDDNFDPYSAVGLKVNVPFWDGGAKRARIGQAAADKKNAVLKRKQAEEKLLLELKTTFSGYQQYRNTLKANIDAVRLSEESFKMTRNMFDSGKVTLADLNDAELLLTSEKLRKEITLYNLNVTLAKIEKLTGADQL